MSVSIFIVIITCVISYYCFQDKNLFDRLKHWPFIEARNQEYYRFVSSGFVHGSWLHLLINMFVLYEFGGFAETVFVYHFGDVMGRVNFVLLYILAIIFADIPTFMKHKDNRGYASIGASGAVSGILFVYILVAPWSKIYLYGIIPIHSIVAGVAYLAYSSWASKNSQDHIDHDAHFYGAVFGFLFALALRPAFFGEFLNKLVNGFPL